MQIEDYQQIEGCNKSCFGRQYYFRANQCNTSNKKKTNISTKIWNCDWTSLKVIKSKLIILSTKILWVKVTLEVKRLTQSFLHSLDKKAFESFTAHSMQITNQHRAQNEKPMSPKNRCEELPQIVAVACLWIIEIRSQKVANKEVFLSNFLPPIISSSFVFCPTRRHRDPWPQTLLILCFSNFLRRLCLHDCVNQQLLFKLRGNTQGLLCCQFLMSILEHHVSSKHSAT